MKAFHFNFQLIIVDKNMFYWNMNAVFRSVIRISK